MSGGEAQRASLARALVRSPSLLLLDEPFSSLDALTRISMYRLALSLWARHRPAVLLVTHDVDEALALADRVLVLGDGRITHSAPVNLPRPRDRDHAELTALRLRLLTELGVPAEEAADPGRNRLMNMPRISAVAVLAAVALAAARCSSAGSSSSPAPAASSAAPGSSSSAVNLSSVTLDVGDQKGTGAEAVLAAAWPPSSLPFHAQLVRLHLRPADARGDGLGLG